MIGANGVYPVTVIVTPRRLAKTVRLKKGQFHFEPGQDSVNLAEHHKKIALLARELTPVVGHPVKVLSVIGVPGCQVLPAGSDQDLVVNERSCVMLVGWRVSVAYLMDEEVQKITEFLLGSCNRQRKDGEVKTEGRARTAGPDLCKDVRHAVSIAYLPRALDAQPVT